ncbi:MAG: hypothetical protein ACD_73C00607G0001 [uncultured bacterium]|nr:MAG: hypothetical protein ACD_73C00607G0001 [uncultured bacterium]
MPHLKEGEKLGLIEWLPSQHFTQPPPRFTEASLVKELEEKGIGRPSTYAAILSVIQEKKYVEKDEQKRFHPTSLGVMVNDLLVESFPLVLDAAFTAKMEEELDAVEEGKQSWKHVLGEFYTPFTSALEKAKVHMKDVKKQEIPTDITCEKCGEKLIVKFGRHGEFLACRNYPECKNTKEFKRDDEGVITLATEETTDEKCEKCGKPMIFKRGRFGKFLACSGYPDCKNTKAISLGVDCPDCNKPLSARNTKRGRVFYGCTGYPKCNFATWDKPVNEKCPDCGHAFLVEKITKSRGTEIKCPNKECSFVKA